MADTLFRNRERIILASGSPRRQALLRQLGITFSVVVSPVDETPAVREKPDAFAVRMAAAKAEKVAVLHPGTWVIGADTVVTKGDKILGKPVTRKRSLEMLTELNGGSHRVCTGFCIQCLEKNILDRKTEWTEVVFARFSRDVLRAYVRTEEPLDKAGAYGIQGAGSFLVKKINGSCSNVIGLPLCSLVSSLLKHQIIEPAVDLQ